jgi:hypothetical protein
MEIAEAKAVLPLPTLLNRLGISTPGRDKFNIQCPLHSEQNGESFAVQCKDGAWLWNCFGKCGRGGDEITFLEAYKNVSRDDAVKLFLEMARNGATKAQPVPRRRDRHRHVVNPGCAVRASTPPISSPLPAAKQASSPAFDWQRYVAAVDDKQIERLRKLRGYSIEFCRWLKENNLLGIIDGHFAFPVHDNGKIVGAHVRLKTGWRYTPTGTKTRPLVIGELHAGDTFHIFESQWDALAFADVCGDRSGIIITRGSGNGALVDDLIPQESTMYVWTQNDETDPKSGKNAGKDWQAAVCEHVQNCTIKIVRTPDQYGDLNDWTRAGATASDLLGAMVAAETVPPPPVLIEFRSPRQLKGFEPPPGLILVGDCHILRGSVFVIGGAPGIGKSRASVALAIAGATGREWFGLTTHRKFKTMVVQTENGLFRLSREFAELDCDTLEDYVRICPPPPYGLCLGREVFRKQLQTWIAKFEPDILVIDPWNAAAREQDAREYLETFDAIRSVLPDPDNAPALGIVAHTRKPKSDERYSGRALLNLLAGSYVLGSVPRTVFIMQAASVDVNDTRVVWACCKNNDGELGDRSAWERRNGLFAPVEFFDWDAFDHPPKEKRGLKPEACREFLMRGREYDKAQIVSIIMKETGRGKTVAYDLVDEAKRCGVLRYHKLTKIYELV